MIYAWVFCRVDVVFVNLTRSQIKFGMTPVGRFWDDTGGEICDDPDGEVCDCKSQRISEQVQGWLSSKILDYAVGKISSFRIKIVDKC